jgi:predicted nucleic acid-binding protein
MVVFDATMLMLALWPDAPAPRNPATGRQVELAAERVAHLIQTLEKRKAKILIPAPALSEVLVRAGRAGPDIVAGIERASVFKIVAFDALAAMEVAIMTRRALDAGDKSSDGEGTWAKIKYDRQIIATARVAGATLLYSDDGNVQKFGLKQGLTVLGLAECPIPTKTAEPPLLQLLADTRKEEVNSVM